jgi:hypothetical protein
MATEEKLSCISLNAGEDLSASQYKAVKIDSDGNAVLAGAGEKSVGVLQDKPLDIGHAGAVGFNGITKAIAGAAITAGSEVEVGTDGKLITLDTGVSLGTATTSAGADGEQFSLLIQ